MIAAETTRTAAIIFPLGHLVEFDIVRRTCLGTQAAMQADVSIDRELIVGNHEAVEVGTDDVAECPRSQSRMGMRLARNPIDNHFRILLKLLGGLGNFLFLALGGVGVHEGQAYVALGHDEREGAGNRQSLDVQLLLQHLYGAADAVAAGTEGVDVVRSGGRWGMDEA